METEETQNERNELKTLKDFFDSGRLSFANKKVLRMFRQVGINNIKDCNEEIEHQHLGSTFCGDYLGAYCNGCERMIKFLDIREEDLK